MTTPPAPFRQSKNLRVILSGLKLILWLSSTLPGITYFLDLAPPLFPIVGIILSVFGFAIILLGFYPRHLRKNYILSANTSFLISLICMAIYGVGFHYWTVGPPVDRDAPRRQIAFYMWPLTDKAIDKIKEVAADKKTNELCTPEELMDYYGVRGGVGREGELWESWAIIAAGLILFVLYLAMFVFFMFGVGRLLRVLHNKNIIS